MNRLKAICEDAFYLTYLEKNAQKEMNRQFCKHDFAHMFQTAQLTYQLLQRENFIANLMEEENKGINKREVIYAAGLLHDIGRWVQYETGEDHALVGARLAYDILNRAGFCSQEIKMIQQAIQEHNKQKVNVSLLGKTLCLADDLVRPCFQCQAKADCYKMPQLEEQKKRMGFVEVEYGEAELQKILSDE